MDIIDLIQISQEQALSAHLSQAALSHHHDGGGLGERQSLERLNCENPSVYIPACALATMRESVPLHDVPIIPHPTSGEV